jgi:D-sedoheptulose 7-phosphate isomerase
VRDELRYFAAAFAAAAASLSRVDENYLRAVAEGAELLIQTFAAGRKVFVFGNGGSAADAQHIAAELVGRFSQERSPLPAIALSTNTALLTAWSNDKGYQDALARELSSVSTAGDVAWAISTSGNSPNVLAALRSARERGLRTLGLTGASGGDMRDLCDVLIAAPATETPRIQELHVVTYHAMCSLIEERLFTRSAESSRVEPGT